MGHRTGLKPIGNERELKNKHTERVWRAPWDEILSTKFKRPFGPVGVAALRQLQPRQFRIFGGIPRHIVDPGIYLVHHYIILRISIRLKMMMTLITVLEN